MVSAAVARVGRAASHPVVLSNPLADLAEDAFRVQVLPELFEAALIVGEVPLEIANRVPLRRALGVSDRRAIGAIEP